MTGSITKRVESGEATETTTKRMLAAVTEVLGKRITAAITSNITPRFTPVGAKVAAATSSWGRTWGIPRDDDGTGSLTSRDGWRGSWSFLAGASNPDPHDNSVKRMISGVTEDTTKRVQETPQA